jgi:hypothetical protein
MNTQTNKSSLMTPPGSRKSSSDSSPKDWPDFLQNHNETEDVVRWNELTSIMEHKTPGKASCSAVYSISKNPKHSLSRISGRLSASSSDIKIKIKMLLDCGCSTNLMGPTAARRLNQLNRLRDADNIKLYNASGKRMSVLGQCEILVKIPELQKQSSLSFLVTEDLPENEQILIGIDALKQLKLLPYNWPHNLNFDFPETSTTKRRTKPNRMQAHLIKTN